MELPEGYTPEEVQNGARVLKRAGGYALAAFVNGVNPENLRCVADADKAYLGAKQSEGGFGIGGGDPERAFMLGGGVTEARKRYLLALEAAYRG